MIDEPASLLGRALGATFRAVGVVRPTAKPLHPRGRLVDARLTLGAAGARTGVPFLDEPRTLDVLVRLSRATGLPTWLPDVHGLALRVPTDDGVGDLLFASTGWGAVSRFVLTASRRPGGRPLTTLLPYRVRGRHAVLGARLDEPHVTIGWAEGAGPFSEVGHLVLGEEREGEPVAFDPVRHQVPGLEVPPWVARLREPAYAGARESRS